MGTDGLVGVVDVLAAVEVCVSCMLRVWERRRSRVDELDVSGVRDEGGSSFSLGISLF